MKRILLALGVVLLMGCSADDPSTNNPNNPNNVNNTNNTNNTNNAQDMGAAGPRYRVGTFNVRRFFDTVCDSNRCGPDDFEEQNSDAEFAFKADIIASAIDDLDLDAIMLEEVESQACVDALMERTQVFDFGVIGETGGRGSLDVVVLSRGKKLQVVSHKDATLVVPGGGASSFARDFLEVHAEVDGRTLILFAAHFKSKRNDDPLRRLAEATGAEEIVSDVARDNPDALIVMGGDLNDVPGTATIDALDEGDLVVLSEPNIWTYAYFEERSQIDHLITVEFGAARYVEGSLEAVRDGSNGYGKSDHAALVAEFMFVDAM